MGEFPSGQRGQTVNLLRIASMVRIRPPPPQKDQHLPVLVFLSLWTDSNYEMQQSGGLLLAAGLDGGNTLIFIPLGNENVPNPSSPVGSSQHLTDWVFWFGRGGHRIQK